MCCDQAKSVDSQKNWFQDRAKQSKKCLLFPIVGILQLLISLEPIDQFQWGFLQNVTVKMVHTVSYKMKTEFDRLQTNFAWSHHTSKVKMNAQSKSSIGPINVSPRVFLGTALFTSRLHVCAQHLSKIYLI